MGLEEWLPWLLGPSVLGLGYKLHLDNVRAYRAWAEAAEARANLHFEQIRILLGQRVNGGEQTDQQSPPTSPPSPTPRRGRRPR